MASSVTIDVDSEKSRDSELHFQDIPHDDSWDPIDRPPEPQGSGKTHTFTNFPHSAADSDDEDDGEKTEFIRDKKNASFWTFEYYQQFFDVETKQVGGRILGSMLPRPGRNYLETHIRPNPDLYGPFWICTTLVFTTAIAGNLANYLQTAGQNYQWVYDFHKVTFAATAIFSYWWVVPVILAGLLWWRGNPERYTLLELLCLYGYSLAIYIPISLLWVIPVSWLLTVWPAVREDKKQVAIGVLVLIFLLHGALAMGFMLYFFHVPGKVTGPTTLTPTNHTTTAPPPKLNQPAHNALNDLPTHIVDQPPQNVNAAHGPPQNLAQEKGRQPQNKSQNVDQSPQGKQPESAAKSSGQETSGGGGVGKGMQPASGGDQPPGNPVPSDQGQKAQFGKLGDGGDSNP